MSAQDSQTDLYRYYRRAKPGLHCFRLLMGESDLWIEATSDCRAAAEKRLKIIRRQLKEYIYQYPQFLTTLTPWDEDLMAPEVVRRMVAAGQSAAVGPMAAVAGAIAGLLGEELLPSNEELLIENGGDLFLRIQQPRVVGIYAGNSPFSWKIGLKIQPGQAWGLCTSSGTVGPSYSKGKADAAVILSPDPALADAVATACANRIKQAADLSSTTEFAARIAGVKGVLLIIGGQLAVWGEVELAKL